jgi:predicted nucleotidyltransferase
MAEYSGFEKIYDIIAIINLIIPVCLKIKNVVSMNYRQDLNQQMNNTLSRNEIISLIKAEKPFLKENFGVIHIGIFGSYAKDRQTIDSDIDFLVEFEEPRFDWIAGLNIYLEKKWIPFQNLIWSICSGMMLMGKGCRRPA